MTESQATDLIAAVNSQVTASEHIADALGSLYWIVYVLVGVLLAYIVSRLIWGVIRQVVG